MSEFMLVSLTRIDSKYAVQIDDTVRSMLEGKGSLRLEFSIDSGDRLTASVFRLEELEELNESLNSFSSLGDNLKLRTVSLNLL